MNNEVIMKYFVFLCAMWMSQAWAHEGHGMPGVAHWHASDLFGLVMALAVVVGMTVNDVSANAIATPAARCVTRSL